MYRRLQSGVPLFSKNLTEIRFYPPTRTKHLEHYEQHNKDNKDLMFHLMNVKKLKRASFDTPSHIKHLLHIAANHVFELHNNHITCK